ncbi:MAG: N-acylglucosamine 2-epimerase [Alphaproteobacteria bacterium CG_4_9_14_3_um_filter_47_13]|nr:MAG: N-acylglucosamine 2-epimerase [Alphaproteobacteria bacterium CG_4_9_14_3_um_filter_47_13]
MAHGTHTTIETLSHRLLQRWVPKWYEAFSVPGTGGFYERLGHSFKPVLTGQRRLVTQCRQLSVYSHALVQGTQRDFPGLADHFEFIVRTYNIAETGGWIFSCDDDGHPLDTDYDLYTLSFAIFAMAHYFQASGDERARVYARKTLDFIDSRFRMAGLSGFVERLDNTLKKRDQPRRHESHMHLLEACLFAVQIFHDLSYMKMADEIVDLFRNYFYDAENNLLSEYFTDDLKPMAKDGKIITEPGHYCEWIWLLKKHAGTSGNNTRYDDLCKPMLEWASTKGWDPKYGGIYDELELSGAIICDTKRLWPLSEALKANALMLDSGVNKKAVKNRIKKMVTVFRDHYMEERGFWTEWLGCDLSRHTDYMPGTSPYHVYFGIMETRDVLNKRGKTCSLVSRPQIAFYRFRRSLSNIIRDIRLGLKKRQT